MFALLKKFLAENQILIVLVGLVAGLLAPNSFTIFHPWNTLLLQSIFFLSALRINLRDLKEYTLDWKMGLLVSGFKLLVLPIAVFFFMKALAPEWSLAFLIALAGPTGMTIALIADFFHGKTSLALVVSVLTSILAPFTMPTLFQALVGTTVRIDPWFMLKDLAYAIIIPFALAFLVDRFAPKIVKKGNAVWRSLSIALFGLLIASIVSKTAGVATDPSELHLSLQNVIALVVAFFYIAFLLWISYRMVAWRTVSERMTVALCMMYMNFTLALYVGDQFFADQRVVPQLVVIVLLLDAMLPLLKTFASRMVEEKSTKY